MADVEKTVNISKELGERLRAVGIDTKEKLLKTGDAKVFERLTQKFPEDACTHTRLALAGAVRGVRWFGLSEEIKAEATRGLERQVRADQHSNASIGVQSLVS
jgi:DNA transformation protein and related proteins